MYVDSASFSGQSYRDRHKRRFARPQSQLFDETISTVQEQVCPVKVRRRRRTQITPSFYDNHEDNESEHVSSKWTIVRQRLPDILALSNTYKPTSVRAQLVLLVALMNKEPTDVTDRSRRLSVHDYNNTISQIVPSNVIIDIGGRSHLICLKRIPIDQVIHVDVDDLSFAIPTRQFILSISRGFAHETAAKYCPPAISDMLIDLSKTKLVDDRRQYKRAQFKMRLGQILFLVIFTFIIAMMFMLIISMTNSIFKFDLPNAKFSIFIQLVARKRHWQVHNRNLTGK